MKFIGKDKVLFKFKIFKVNCNFLDKVFFLKFLKDRVCVFVWNWNWMVFVLIVVVIGINKEWWIFNNCSCCRFWVFIFECLRDNC